jgi:4-hydroxy-tetrahydrodipicolinate reductase
MKIALIGYGKMGKAIEPLAIQKGHDIVFKADRSGFQASELDDADVCIEFTTPEAGFENISKCLQAGKPVVSGTTGWLARWDEIVDFVNQANGAFFYASNFSLGVNIFFALNQYLAKIMNRFEQYDVRVHEVHHTQKKDVPSGTAITLAERVIAEIDRKSGFELDASANNLLKISAERKDRTPGTHHVKYSSNIDDIELIHTAHSRLGFANGALMAAEWLPGKQGVFGMDDLLNLNA